MKIQTSTHVRHGQDGKRYDLRAGTHTVPDAVGEHLVRRGYAVAIEEAQAELVALPVPAEPAPEAAPAAAGEAYMDADEMQSEDAVEDAVDTAQAEPAAAEPAPAGKSRGGKRAQG